MISGSCRGGPLDGKEAESRFPKGFVLVNRPAQQVVVYDFDGDSFNARPVASEIFEGRIRAAMEPNYDVVAYDEEEMGPWAR